MTALQCRRWISVLRDYQQECIENSLKALNDGIKRQVVSMPVGSGKTVIFSNLIPNIPCPSPTATKTLVLAHRRELLTQACRQIQRFSPSLKIAYDLQKKSPNGEEDVIISSIQTISRRLSNYDPKDFKCIIVDEAHHATANSYFKIFNHFDLFSETSHILLWGCSATLRRHDRVALQNVFQKIVHKCDFMDLIERGILSNFRVLTVATKTQLNVKISKGDFQNNALSKCLDTPERNQLIFNTYRYAIRDQGYLSTLIFAVDIRHCESLCQLFRENGIQADYVHSKMPDYRRQEILSNFSEGKIPVLVNCAILTEGVDIPRIDSIILGRPTKSATLLQQMLGRGLRLSPEKKDCLIIDLHDIVNKSTITNVPTLFGFPCHFKFKPNLSIVELAPKIKALTEAQKIHATGSETIEETSDIYFLLNEDIRDPKSARDMTEEAILLKELTDLFWIHVGENYFTINAHIQRYEIQKQLDQFVGFKIIRHQTKNAFVYCEQKICLGRWKTAKEAFKNMDLQIHRDLPAHQYSGLRVDAPWRQKEPTDKQLEFIKKKYRVEVTGKPLIGTEMGKDTQLTRGIAARMIEKYLHGAIRYHRFKEQKRKQQRKLQKLMDQL